MTAYIICKCLTVPYGNVGCNGGDIMKAMKFVIANGGISTEASYPYVEHVRLH